MNKRTLRYKEEYTGKTFDTNSCGKCTVILFENSQNVTVGFHDNPCVVRSNLTNLRLGKLLNPMHPSCSGIGYVGVGKYLPSDKKVYYPWYGMIQRVYNEKYRHRFEAYKDVVVCDEWHNFQNYAEWCYSQKFFKAEDHNGKPYHLDKDILSVGNKVYSPETCCYVPHCINSLVQDSYKITEEHSLGIYLRKSTGKYEPSVRFEGKKLSLGRFDTSEEAFQVYKKTKEGIIKEVAEKWKGNIDDKAYEALMKYEVVN